MFQKIIVKNPKLNSSENSIYPYYAGFNPQFVNSVLSSCELSSNAQILDPWNGSGTTTNQAHINGYNSFGIDINPVMILLSKASLVPHQEETSILALSRLIIKKFKTISSKTNIDKDDPLCIWFQPSSVVAIRRLQNIINEFLSIHSNLNVIEFVEGISSYSALIHTAVLRVVRKLGSNFKSSNPTWIKKPKNKFARVRPSEIRIIKLFEEEILNLLLKVRNRPICCGGADVNLFVGNSNSTDIEEASIDLVITSPPYCTRIDYAVSMQIELAYLHYSDLMFSELRDQMIGSSTINNKILNENCYLGNKVNVFLNQVKNHSSKASKTYYYKTLKQYYTSIYNSLQHQNKLIKKDGGLVLVVQDSYYKEVHNNLQENITELAVMSGFELNERFDFKCSKNMANLNSEAKNYRKKIKATESVLCFQKT